MGDINVDARNQKELAQNTFLQRAENIRTIDIFNRI